VSESNAKPVRQPSVSSAGTRDGPVIKSDGGLGKEVHEDVPEGSVNQEEGGTGNSQAPTAISRGPAGPLKTVTVEHGENVPEQEVSIARGSDGPVIGLEKLGGEVEKGVPKGLVNEEEGGGANPQARTAISRGPAGPSNTVTVEHGESVPEQEVSIARGSDGPVIGLEKLGGEVDKGVPQGLVNEGGGSSGRFQVNEPALSQALDGKRVQKDTWESEEGGEVIMGMGV
jgi:hypothetical protein